MATEQRIRELRSRIQTIWTVWNSEVLGHAEVILNQVDTGEKSDRLLSTVEGHIESAERLNRINMD